jgi:hypothetical protein
MNIKALVVRNDGNGKINKQWVDVSKKDLKKVSIDKAKELFDDSGIEVYSIEIITINGELRDPQFLHHRKG